MIYETRDEGDVRVVVIQGEVDLLYADDMRTVLLEGIRSPACGVLVDMTGVTLIDSSGIASLLEALQTGRKRGKSLVLAGVGDHVMRVFKLARLETVFVMADTVEEGLLKTG
jgi:anti-sigma B factor antagonist